MNQNQCLVSFVASNAEMQMRSLRTSGTVLVNYESGLDPEIAALRAISDAFNCPMDDITLLILKELTDD